MFRRTLMAIAVAAGALVTGLGTASAASASVGAIPGGGQAATGCHIVSDLYRDGNTIFAAAETVPCEVPISVALYRNGELVAQQSGGAAPHIEFPCTPVSFDVFWKNSRGDKLTTNCF
ncbi:hypothetical protein [Actinoplanes sp. NPDC026623]|uniref:hypothetical protein n=1 Tax=Actinoplanes sp. NPDC026623 TaxID=3155610 RepID=UPI0033FCE542